MGTRYKLMGSNPDFKIQIFLTLSLLICFTPLKCCLYVTAHNSHITSEDVRL